MAETRTCPGCKQTFEESESAEEKLLQALFSHGDLCPQCHKIRQGYAVLCATCGNYTENVVTINGILRHSGCIRHYDN